MYEYQPTKSGYFYPALLAESDSARSLFSIHFSHFYPRSPCGERPRKGQSSGAGTGISIHALLAESDVVGAPEGADTEHISIHALLAESDS